MYYRVAIQGDSSALWQWKSTMLSSLDALFQFLRLYRALPQDRLRVFSSSSREEMNEQLARENKALGSISVTAAQFLQERKIDPLEGRWEAAEHRTQEIDRIAPIAVVNNPSPNESSKGAHPLEEQARSFLEQRRGELERGAGGDYDFPYRFTLPTSQPQILAWMRLLTKIQNGELLP